MSDTQTRRDIYQTITDKVVADLERGVRSWNKPWSGGSSGSLPLRAIGKPYQGINVLLLWIEAAVKGYGSPVWMTFNQAREIGANIRKGEKGSMVVYANAITKTETDAKTGEDSERRIPFLKAYTVFNLAQIENLPAAWNVQAETQRLSETDRIAAAEAFFKATSAEVRHGGTRAYYAPAQDAITMPPFAAFETAERYYSVLGHECIHWTAHEGRANRPIRNVKGSDAYAREELVAELGAAFLCADLGLSDEPREDHASYLASWLQVLKDDKRAIVTAAAAAQRAANYLHDIVGSRNAAADEPAESAAA